MKKQLSIGFAVSVTALASALTFVLTLSYSRKTFNEQITEVDRLSAKYQRLEELDEKIQAEYYTDVPTDDVIEGMLAGYVEGLGDRYSTYRSAEDYAAYEDSNAGIYTGIGITVQKNDEGNAEVLAVSPDSSADRAGIVAGDEVVEVEGVSVKESYREAIDLIGGELGTSVKIRVRKKSTDSVERLSLLRAQIDEETVTYKLLYNRIGYISISKFRTVTVQQFQEARESLLKQGAKGLIFDVRDNGGGVLSALEQIVDPMLPEGDLAFAHDREGNATTILKSDAEFDQMPYVILVNGNSASAAELFACVLRDYADAILVGEKTFGKGIMQTTFQLSSGGLTLTTATYETGITPCYHGVGLEPDILSEADPESEEDVQLNAAIDAMTERMQSDEK